jgi:hypothetical protein
MVQPEGTVHVYVCEPAAVTEYVWDTPEHEVALPLTVAFGRAFTVTVAVLVIVAEQVVLEFTPTTV